MAGTHISFTTSFKLHAVELAESMSKSRATKEFNVDVRRVREWYKQKDQLLVKEYGQLRKKWLDGRGRKASYKDMEEIMFHWVMELRSRNYHVSQRMIVERAKEQSCESAPNFNASRGWLYWFMKWKGLSLRQKTTVHQSMPADWAPKLVSFIRHLREL